jgi:hypothetical protein
MPPTLVTLATAEAHDQERRSVATLKSLLSTTIQPIDGQIT